MRKPILTIAAALAVSLVSTACAGDPAGDATTSTSPGSEQTTTTPADDATTAGETNETSITIENFTFSGATSVAVGTTVTVTNEDGVTHTWTSVDDVWNSGGISGGESFEFTFEESGEFPYFCSIHPTMEGTITVEG